ncbi:hypothetical protein GCM10022222_22660 [Amycolatopsis ultiminotia]|uniref:Uncharacterized protein n=1 Tax=Amycolatopsis ultiminotia TaxID=543629 RepID=A0ABP6VMW5_9PSEU
MDEATLTTFAFGDPPCATGALGAFAGASPRHRLLAAIVLGAQGRYAAATTILDSLRRGRDPLVASLAASTLASHRRQLGGHAAARKLDGAALLAVGFSSTEPDPAGLTANGPSVAGPGSSGSGGAGPGPDEPGVADAVGPGASAAAPGTADPHGLDVVGARADALLGLAADNLALGRLGAARRLVVRAARVDRRWRAAVRGGWVAAEIELADGQPAAAVAPARNALETARARGARRHAVKSAIVLGVALSGAGETGALELVTEAVEETEKYELNSLIWVATRVAADLDARRDQEYRFRSRQVLHAVLQQADPCVMRIARESPWVPTGVG